MSTPSPHQPFEQTLPMLLLRAREALLDPVRSVLRAFGLTDQQWRVLRVLSQSGEMEMSRLAQTVFIRPPSLTRIVRDLAERGFVARRVDGDDRRIVLLSIAPAGRACMEEALPTVLGLGRDMRAKVGPERVDELKALLLVVLDAAGEVEL